MILVVARDRDDGDVLVADQVLGARVATHARIARRDAVQARLVQVAQRDQAAIGMMVERRRKLLADTEADHADAELLARHRAPTALDGVGRSDDGVEAMPCCRFAEPGEDRLHPLQVLQRVDGQLHLRPRVCAFEAHDAHARRVRVEPGRHVLALVRRRHRLDRALESRNGNDLDRLPLGERAAHDIADELGPLAAIELDRPIHDRGIDQRAVGIDPHQGVSLRRHRSVQEAAGDVVERAAIELHGLRPGELGDGVVIGIGRGGDPQAIDGAAAAQRGRPHGRAALCPGSLARLCRAAGVNSCGPAEPQRWTASSRGTILRVLGRFDSARARISQERVPGEQASARIRRALLLLGKVGGGVGGSILKVK